MKNSSINPTNQTFNKNLAGYIILLGIALTPLYTSFEFLQAVFKVRGGLITPVHIKIVKDMTIMLAIFVWFLSRYKKIQLNKHLLSIYVVICICAAISIFKNPLLITAAGCRWAVPLFLLPVILDILSERHIKYIAPILLMLLLLGLTLQIKTAISYVLLRAFANFHATRFVGFCSNPSTTAGIALVALYFSRNFKRSPLLRAFILIVATLSIYLTSSASAMISLGLYIVLMILMRLKIKPRKILISLIISGAILLSISSAITGRKEIVRYSLGIRVGIFTDLMKSSSVFSSDFGKYTNTGYMLRFVDIDSIAEIPDSTPASLIGNLGWSGLLLFAAFLARCLLRDLDEEKLLFIAIFMPLFFTTVLFETYPLYLLFSLEIARFSASIPSMKNINLGNPINLFRDILALKT